MGLSEEISEWRAIGSSPIRAEFPAGDPVRYDPDFEQLQMEMNKLETFVGQPVAWKEVVTLGKKIIEGKSKDLLVASYLCLGLFEEKGYRGLMAGMSCMEGMVISFWESLYPEAKRMRGRINVIGWLSEKGGMAVGKKPPRPDEKEVVEGCIQRIEVLEKFLGEKLGSDFPGLGDLRRAVQEALQTAESGHDTGKVTEPKPSPPTAVQNQAVITDVTSVEDSRRILQDAEKMMRLATSFVHGQDSCNPWPYRMVRVLAWMEVDAAPPDTDGKTLIPPPQERLIQLYPSLAERAEWMELLNQAESQIQEFPFWLDLHRFSAMAFTHLGPDYGKAKEAVNAELLTLLRRLPILLELQFSNGMPFADEETRKWIETDIFPSGDGTSGSRMPAGSPKQEGQADTFAEVREKASGLMRDGQPREAMGLFQQFLAAATSQRERFVARFELAKLCLEKGYLKMAVSQLQALDQEIRRFSLEEWEPTLSLEVLQLLWRSLSRMSQEAEQISPEIVHQAHEVYGRLCRLDVLAALDLENKRKSGWFGR